MPNKKDALTLKHSWWIVSGKPEYFIDLAANGFEVKRTVHCKRDVITDRYSYSDNHEKFNENFVFPTWNRASKWLEKDFKKYSKGDKYKKSHQIWVKEPRDA